MVDMYSLIKAHQPIKAVKDEKYEDRDAEEVARELDLKVVNGRPNILMLDLDTPESVKLFAERYTDLEALVPDIFSKGNPLYTTSKSGKNHAYVRLGREFTDLERIGLQAVLGSDLKREFLSVRRLLGCLREEASVLFETEAEYGKVVEFLFPATEF